MTINLSDLSYFVRVDHDNLLKEALDLGLSPEQAEKYLNTKLKKNITAAIQTLNYQVQTLSDDIFISVSMDIKGWKGYEKETAMLMEEVIKQRIKGLPDERGQYVTQTFPKLLFITYDEMFNKNSKYYPLLRLAAESTAKRMSPDFISAKISKEYKEGNVVPSMGCVAGEEVVSYKIEGKLFVESISRMYNRLASLNNEELQENKVDNIIYLNDVQIYDAVKGWVKCKSIIKNHNYDNWKEVHFSDGRRVIVTSDHPFTIKFGEDKRADCLTIGDSVKIDYTQPCGEEDYPENKAWLEGFFLCDGCYSGHYSASIAAFGEDDIEEAFIKYSKEYYNINVVTKLQERGKKGTYKDLNGKSSHLGQITEIAKNYFIPLYGGKKKADRHIPEYVFRSNSKVRIKFLAGIVDADGYYNNRAGTIQVGSTNKELALQQMLIAQSLGMNARMYYNHYNSKKPEKIRYRIEFVPTEEFFNCLVCKKKYSEYLVIDNKVWNEYASVKEVLDSNYNGNSYDVETESEHFSFSGIYSHNCRSELSPWKDADGQYKFWGRGNLGVVSLNLAYIGLEAKFSKDDNKIQSFKDKLKVYFNYALKAHKVRISRIANCKVDIAPILWMYGVFSRAKSGTLIKDIIKDGYFTASIGYAGLAEAVEALGVHYVTKEGQKLGIEILKYLNELCNNAKKNSSLHIAYSIYGTPIESTVKKFATSIKRFPIVEHVNDRDYITNSYHVPVEYKINAFDKFDFESPFQKYSTGGCISYIECGNLEKNIDAVMEIIKCINDEMYYAEINVRHADVCHKCGYHGEIKYVGKGVWQCPNCGNTDIRQMTRIRRVCGYLSTNDWNTARTSEIINRVIHIQ